MHLPAFLGRGRPATGADATVGSVLRVAGATGLALAAFGLLMAALGAWTLLRMQTAGDQTGWDDLIGAVALGLGLLMALGGSVVATGAHAAFNGWRDGRTRPVRVTGWAFVALGVVALLPGALQGFEVPLDSYVFIAGLVVLSVGGVLLSWARGRRRD